MHKIQRAIYMFNVNDTILHTLTAALRPDCKYGTLTVGILTADGKMRVGCVQKIKPRNWLATDHSKRAAAWSL